MRDRNNPNFYLDETLRFFVHDDESRMLLTAKTEDGTETKTPYHDRKWLSVSEVVNGVIAQTPELDNTPFRRDIQLVISQLEADKLIMPQVHNETYSNKFYTYTITFNGKMFAANDGYQGTVNRQNAENIRLGNVEKSQRAYERRQIYLTAILAVSAFFAVPYYLFEMSKETHAVHAVCLLTALFLFLCGVVATAIVSLIAKEITQRRT